jgi:hypothetical protein
METAAQMCARLVTALEDLAAQEAVCVQTRNFAAVVAIQDRAAPLVELLASHEGDITDAAVRTRIKNLLERRNETGAWLIREIERTRERLHSLEASQRRVARIAPAYGQSSGPRRQLSAVG